MHLQQEFHLKKKEVQTSSTGTWYIISVSVQSVGPTDLGTLFFDGSVFLSNDLTTNFVRIPPLEGDTHRVIGDLTL